MSAYGMNCPPPGQAALVCLLLAPCNVRFGGNPDITNTRAVSRTKMVPLPTTGHGITTITMPPNGMLRLSVTAAGALK
jgi:hypothetical protein